MKGKDILLGLQYVGDDLIMEAEAKSFPGQKKLFRRPLLLAAAVALMLALVGCAVVYVMTMQDLKLGDQQVAQERWDDDGRTMIYETVQQQVLTFSGLKGTPNYEAAKEWYAFRQTYDPDWILYNEYRDAGTLYRAPEEYSLYNIYTPEMREKIDEITSKHGLKLQGSRVDAFSDEALLSYLGIRNILLPDAKASGEDFNVSYYDGGWFHTDMRMQLTDMPEWPFQFLCSLYYSPKDCFDTMVCELNDTEDWQEWNYTTASGDDVLVIRSPSVWVSWVFCDRGDATITLRIETILEWYGDSGVKKTPMTDDQLKQVLDCIDFSIHPQPGDPALLEGPKASRVLSQTQNGHTVSVKDVFTDGSEAHIILGIAGPEGTDLEQFSNMAYSSLRFDGVQFTSQENASVQASGTSHGPRADQDGKKNTMEYQVTVSKEVRDGLAFQQGSVWKLYLDDLLVQQWNPDLKQWERIWETEGIWNFEIPMDQGDWREIEFVSDPIETSVCTGWDADGSDVFQDVTLTSLTLRAFGGKATSTWERGQLDFANMREKKYPTVVLKDGTTIALAGDLRIYDPESDGDRIPMDEVEHLILMDGTRLFPVN